LYRTTDGGENWKEIENLNIAFNGYITLFSTEPDFFYITTSGNAAYTNDGGITWNNLNLSTTFLEIYFLDSKNGIAGDGYSWITSDGGKTWNRKGELSWPRGFYFHAHELGWAVGYSPFATDVGYIAKTTDGGTSWKYQDSAFGGMVDYLGVEFLDSLKGFAVGGSAGKTIDGGNNWQTIPGVGGYDVGFLDDRNGWISSAGQIFRTNDGGETWETQLDTVKNFSFKKIIILKKDKVAYVLGVNPGNNNATLLRADLSNITGVEENKQAIPEKYNLAQNYPNPFNPTTSIEYQVSRLEMVTLKIYDILGNEIATLVNETKLPGTYKVNFNGNQLASGVYIYRIQAGRFSNIKKLILMK
jgi:photosystem II stability/assembly factor-like uncharacterized protein